MPTWRPTDEGFEPVRQSDYDYDTQLFERPREALQHLKEEMRQEYLADQSRRQARAPHIRRMRAEHPWTRDLSEEDIHREIDLRLTEPRWQAAGLDKVGEFLDAVAHGLRGPSSGGGSRDDVPEGSITALRREQDAQRAQAREDAYYDRTRDDHDRWR